MEQINYIAKNDRYIIFELFGRCFIFLTPISRLAELVRGECVETHGDKIFLKKAFEEKLKSLDGFFMEKDAEGYFTNAAILKDKSGSLKPAVSALNLDLTPQCNLGCVYCYAGGGDYSSQDKVMRPETVIEALGQGSDFIDSSRDFRFEFFGGEPLFNAGAIKSVLEFEKKVRRREAGFEVFADKIGGRIINRISTNLTSLDDDILKLLAEGDFIISVSIDGARKTQNAQRPYKTGEGSYDDIINNVKKIKAAAPHLTVVARITVYSNPSGFLEELKELVSLNIFDYCSVYCAAIGSSDGGGLSLAEEFKTSYRMMAENYGSLLSGKGNIFKGCLELNRYICYLTEGGLALNHCRAGAGYFTLAPDGSVYPCHRLIGKTEFRIEGGLTGIEDAAKEWKTSVDERPVCRSCPIRYLCGGGCKQEALISGGSLLAYNSKICDFAGLLFESALIAAVKTGGEGLKKITQSCGALDSLFVLCGRDNIKASREAAGETEKILKGFASRALFFILLISLSAVFTFGGFRLSPFYPQISPAGACPGTNEPWHELTVENKGAVYLDSGYFVSYGEAEGLAAKSIKCLAYSQKSKTLFIGSKENGVILFDGKKFSPLITDPPLPSDNILSLCYCEADGRLAVGTNAGLAIISNISAASSSQARIINLKNSDIQGDTIYSLASDSASNVYAGTDHGFFTVFAGSVKEIVRVTSAGAEIGKVNSIYCDENRTLHLATDLMVLKTADCRKFDPEDFSAASSVNGATKISKVKVSSPAGSETSEVKLDPDMALSSAAGLTVSKSNGRTVTIGVNEGLAENWVSCFACDNFAMESEKAKITLDAGALSAKTAGENQKSPSDLESLVKRLRKFASADTVIEKNGDSVTLKTREMSSLLANPDFQAVNEAYDLFSVTETVQAPKNPALESLASGLWVGTANSGLAVFNGSEFVIFNKDNSPLSSNKICDILCCGDFVYIATDGGGLLKYGQFDAPAPSGEIEKILDGKHDFIKAIGSDVYIGGKKGLYHYNLIDSTSEVMPEKPELKNIAGACADDTGSIYLASGDAGIVKLEGKYKVANSNKYRFRTVTSFSKKDGTPSGACSAVYNIENKGVIAGFSEISCKISEKCIIISADGKITGFDPQAGATRSEYDFTQPTLAAPSAFLNSGDAVFAGLNEGDSNALVFFSGSAWQYMTTPISCVFTRVNSINRSGNGDVYIAGDSGVAVFNGKEWKKIDYSGGVPVNDSVCAMRDTVSDGAWILRKFKAGSAGASSTVITYGSKRVLYAKTLEGAGISFAQLDPYVLVLTTKGVYKIKKQ
ncbi:MAG: Anaerobic sulfatase-maturating enzyme [bacterium ADurb.Bin243]|nr:MAG: Anaerobic sulfatase-maturating enzyme [bacterium ADurb.Bin243]